MPEHEHINWEQHHGKAFRIAQTPSGSAYAHGAKKGDSPLPDDPDRWSIVTPENKEAWTDWPAAPDKHVAQAKENWDTIQKDPQSQYKMDQIRRSMK